MTERALAAYRDLLLTWNRSVNLTSAKTAADLDEHIADCMHLVEHLPLAGSLVDVGSGGGLPAIVIAIARPSIAVTALEPTHKKHAFLRTAARELALANLDPRAERVEDHTRSDYDLATSRATFGILAWLELGAELVRPGGLVLGMEGRDRSELPAGIVRHPYDLGDKTRAILAKNVAISK